MKKIIVILCYLIVSLAQASADQDGAFKEFDAKFVKAQTIEVLIDATQEALSKEDLKFIQSRVSDRQQKIKIEKVSDKNYAIQVASTYVSLEFVSTNADNFIFKLNNKAIQISDFVSLQDLWAKAESVLPKTASYKESIFFKSAYAFSPLIDLTASAAALTVRYLYSRLSCLHVDEMKKKCESGALKLNNLDITEKLHYWPIARKAPGCVGAINFVSKCIDKIKKPKKGLIYRERIRKDNRLKAD